jgi:hypothetical protein
VTFQKAHFPTLTARLGYLSTSASAAKISSLEIHNSHRFPAFLPSVLVISHHVHKREVSDPKGIGFSPGTAATRRASPERTYRADMYLPAWKTCLNPLTDTSRYAPVLVGSTVKLCAVKSPMLRAVGPLKSST